MAIVNLIDPTTFEPQQYSLGDENSIPRFPVNSTFSTNAGKVEAIVYDLNGNLLNYNSDSSFSIIENGGNGDINLGDALNIYPQKEVEELGYSIGSYNVVYNILNNEPFLLYNSKL